MADERKKKSNSVLTESDLKAAEGQKTPPAKSKPKSPKQKSQDIVYECGFAPAGKSRICFTYKHTEGKKEKVYKYELDLVDKRFTLPKDLSKTDMDRYRKALIANNFIDVTTSESKGVIFDKEHAEYIYTAVHPEHCEKNKINGNISLVLVGDDGRPLYDEKGDTVFKQVTIQNGKVVTKDAMVYKALLQAGFCSGSKIEVKEDEG